MPVDQLAAARAELEDELGPATGNLAGEIGPAPAPAPAYLVREASSSEQLRLLWSMTPAQRVAAMRRGELRLEQCFAWAARHPHEVPTIDGALEFLAGGSLERANLASAPSASPAGDSVPGMPALDGITLTRRVPRAPRRVHDPRQPPVDVGDRCHRRGARGMTPIDDLVLDSADALLAELDDGHGGARRRAGALDRLSDTLAELDSALVVPPAVTEVAEGVDIARLAVVVCGRRRRGRS